MGEATKRQRAASKPHDARSEASFEEAVERLEQIVRRLESENLPLEDALALFEEGVNLSRTSQHKLEQAERRVEELLSVDADGKPVVRNLATEDEDED